MVNNMFVIIVLSILLLDLCSYVVAGNSLLDVFGTLKVMMYANVVLV